MYASDRIEEVFQAFKIHVIDCAIGNFFLLFMTNNL